MRTIKGPAIFLAQFAADKPPFDTLDGIAKWAADLGYKGIQIPTWDTRIFDLAKAAGSSEYCDEIKGRLAALGIEVTELSTHLQGQLVATHPAYDSLYDGFAPPAVRGKPAERQRWAVDQLKLAAHASRNLGLDVAVTFSGSLAWPYVYPWPQRPAGLIEAAFQELGNRWRPILDAYEENGIDLGFEVHPGEDLHDGITFERFLGNVGGHARAAILYDPSHLVLQHLDYLAFLEIYHERIKAVHVKDAELRYAGRSGVYGGYQEWAARPGRFRSLGDGQVDFGAIFSCLAEHDYSGWAVLEWECALKHPEDGAREGASFIRDHIIRVADRTFDDFAASGMDEGLNAALLGIGR